MIGQTLSEIEAGTEHPFLEDSGLFDQTNILSKSERSEILSGPTPMDIGTHVENVRRTSAVVPSTPPGSVK